MLYSPLDDGISQQVVLKNGEVALIRPLVGEDDLQACLDIQLAVWGDGPHSGLMGHSVLGVIPFVGGLVAGAFVDDILQAVLIGFSGFSKTALAQWSSRLAVYPQYRDSGLGYEMKRYQRLVCREMGIKSIYWTYDPLESRNAHFNLNKLGATVVSYKENAYGLSDSPLHQGLGTDRFVVCWDVLAPSFSYKTYDLAMLPDWVDSACVTSSVRYKVMIPSDIQALREQDSDAAFSHRLRTRSIFQSVFALGFVVAGFQRDGDNSYYILEKPLHNESGKAFGGKKPDRVSCKDAKSCVFTETQHDALCRGFLEKL